MGSSSFAIGVQFMIVCYNILHNSTSSDSDMVVRQVSPGQTWCVILCLVSVWCSHLYDMSVCPSLTLKTVVITIPTDSYF